MAIKSNSENHGVWWLEQLNSKGQLHTNISIQRKEVWDSVRKSNLIISILLDVPIESLLFEEVSDDEAFVEQTSEKRKRGKKNEEYNVLDGKQRTLTLCAFLTNGFALSPKIRIKEIDGVALAGLRFSELPEELQTKIRDYELSISVLRPLDAEDRATVFFMRNQAVSLSKMDLSLVMLGEDAMGKLNEICNHNFMLNKVKITEPARRKHTDLQVLLQYLILVTKPDMGFSGTEIMSFCDDIKNSEIEIPSEETLKLLDYLDEALPTKRQYLGKAHIPAVLYAAREAMNNAVETAEFGSKLDEFFADIVDHAEYVATYGSGSAKRSNVQARVRLLCDTVVPNE